MDDRIDVIATTISGSIQDWKKVERIQPLFAQNGLSNVQVHVVASHAEARQTACEALSAGGRIPISAGGSGTFRAVLEGCIDSGVRLGEIRLGFLRKGSADLIGKVLGMPDDVEAAASVFADSLRSGRLVPCDVLAANELGSKRPELHFVGYGGAELFGRIPHFTENRLMKWYKGILGQIFGDLGPFTTGMTLALLERLMKAPFTRNPTWRIVVDGNEVAHGRFQALILVNGYLGPELAFSNDALGSGRFHLIALRDLGTRHLLAQARRARRGALDADSERGGFERFVISEHLELLSDSPRSFPANIDGSTLVCREGLHVRRFDQVQLISGASALTPATAAPGPRSQPRDGTY